MNSHEEIRFSILVPVYNAERFLSECIESALNQTYKNFEIILVDDGSTDASGAICDQYAASYGQVSVYHTENGGQIHAREFAVRQAKGDFFVFLDADDRLRSNALETIAAAINKYECDCAIFGFVRLINETIVPVSEDETEEALTNKRDIYRKCIDGQYNAIWRKAVKATVWKQDISDTEVLQIRLGEDLIQSLKVFKSSDRIAFIKDAIYEYRDNPNGITYTVTYDAYRKSMCVNEMVYQFLKQEQVFTEQDFDEFRQICMGKHVDELLRVCYLKAKTIDKLHLIQELRNTDYFRNFVNQGQVNQLPYKRRILFLLSRWRLDYGIVLLAKIYAKWLHRGTKK